MAFSSRQSVQRLITSPVTGFFQRFMVQAAMCVAPVVAQAADLHVAVAANFAAPMKIIAEHFERDTGHRVALAFGATGQFYAQIRNGAPYAILLAADQKTPARLSEEGFSVKGSAFTYAIGRLVFWSRDAGLIDSSDAVLRSAAFDRIAIANPKLAPYREAAVQVISGVGLMPTLAPKMVEGSSIAQTFQFVASGNATVGFVALSQVFQNGKLGQGSGWIVPDDMYTPIRQDAVLLNPGQDNPPALALMDYLRGDKARNVMASFGYGF